MADPEYESFDEPLRTLGQFLQEREQRFEVLAVGGGALQLLGLIARPTRDIDVVALVDDADLVPVDALPTALESAVRDTADVLRMPRTWLNVGPRSLLDLGLPEGMLSRAVTRTWGGLTVRLAGRRDQIFLKLYAAVDQGPRSKHFEDLRQLEPTREELLAASSWARTHDPSEGFDRELEAALRGLGVDDADA